MAKFKLAADKTFSFGGVLKTFEKGEYETTDKAELEALKGAKDVEEVKQSASKAKPKD